MPRYASDMNEADYTSAVEFCTNAGFVSTGKIQRHLCIGWNAAARLVEWMEERNFCSKADFQGRRTLLDQ